jgi:hypothetical protein
MRVHFHTLRQYASAIDPSQMFTLSRALSVR